MPNKSAPTPNRTALLQEIVFQLGRSDFLLNVRENSDRVLFSYGDWAYELNVHKLAEGQTYERRRALNANTSKLNRALRNEFPEDFNNRCGFWKRVGLTSAQAHAKAYSDLRKLHQGRWLEIRRASVD